MTRFIDLSHFFWFKQCKQSNGVYSEKKSVEEILDEELDPWKLSWVSVLDTFVHDFRTSYLQDTFNIAP